VVSPPKWNSKGKFERKGGDSRFKKKKKKKKEKNEIGRGRRDWTKILWEKESRKEKVQRETKKINSAEEVAFECWQGKKRS